ncbi:DeoR/GlpR family DNA-binding transcription regulator [Jatrophihabitans telluris]|uniref:DeoR/GlpR family DNA-binding transcription regulator n=1 Tax=Jatrophihabitans telluris TaxID=2038343 RepID=A0ABY4QYM8_9ACTN|nr:DeoR/GlpR family DNA-binding transcription regulator [Jatrophihabitans telluris]UQX88227.1 DeoR/GlpR family DNA-binding transcription regulator [Jatrophihabitans telluris]
MLSHERKREVLRHLRSHGIGQVNELAEAIGVSASTIRRDLKEMDSQGLLTRVHGGASLIENDLEVAHMARQSEHSAQKRRIGEAATSLVKDNSTILITGGTTTEAMLPFLHGRDGLTVLTNGLNVAVQLSRQANITVVVLGGILRHAEMSLLGPLAEHAMEEFRVDTAFTGTYGLDASVGLTGASVHEASTDRKLLEGVGSLVVLADSTKFTQRGPVRLASVEQIDVVITDSGAPSSAVHELRAGGVDVRLV